MHQVVKVLKLGQKSSRVQLDDGRKVRVPLSVVTIGFIADEDIQKVETSGVVDYVHVSFYKPPRKRAEPVLCRDMSQFDASAELKLLRGIVIKNVRVVFNRTDYTEEAIDDLTEDCFLHFWERKLFQRYNATRLSSYTSYLSRAVRNYLIDLKRNSKFKTESKMKSLDKQIKDGEGNTLMSLLPSDYDLEGEAVVSLLSATCGEMLKQFELITRRLDTEESTGLTFTYLELFNALFIKGNYPQFILASGYSSSTVNSRKQFLLDMLLPTYKEFMYA